MSDEEYGGFDEEEEGEDYGEDYGEDGDDDGSGGESGPAEKLCGGCFCMCIGIVLLAGTLFGLGWNENNFVCENKKILYADDKAVDEGCDPAKLAGKFAYFSCPMIEDKLPTWTMANFAKGFNSEASMPPESQFSFKSSAAKQSVTMYQCIEHMKEETRGGDRRRKGTKVKVYTYSTDWSAEYHDTISDAKKAKKSCQGFSGSNPAVPANIALGSEEEWASTVEVGAAQNSTKTLTLDQELVKQLYPDDLVALSTFQSKFATDNGTATVWFGGGSTPPSPVNTGNLGVVGSSFQTCTKDALGCVRITYHMNSAKTPSVITKVKDAGGLTGAETVPKSWGCPEDEYQVIHKEKQTKEQMVKSLHENNQTQAWVIRVVGVLMAWISMWCCLQPVAALVDVMGDCVAFIPCVGEYLEDMMETIVGVIICCMSCATGVSCALFVIAVVWIAMRPIVGGALMAVCLLMCCCVGGLACTFKGKTKKGKKGKRGSKSAREQSLREAGSPLVE